MQIAEGVRLVTFGILSAMMLGSALGVVLLGNIVYSAFLLAGVFIAMAGIYLLLNADFVSAAQILVYVGAVNVLILFAIMLVNKREDFKPVKNTLLKQGATALVCAGLFVLLAVVGATTPWKLSTDLPVASSLVPIAQHFFTDFLLPFELASILLLMAMVGAIVLARRDFVPDPVPGQASGVDSLTLPERPRELVATSATPIDE
jgi:NAD(P)H-quinone oxidoreductase subunit 6